MPPAPVLASALRAVLLIAFSSQIAAGHISNDQIDTLVKSVCDIGTAATVIWSLWASWRKHSALKAAKEDVAICEAKS